jgi:hypothetical protein
MNEALRQREIREVLDADVNINKQVLNNYYKQVRVFSDALPQPTTLEAIVSFNIVKYFLLLKNALQSVVDKYLAGKDITNSENVLYHYNVLITYIRNFAKSHTLSQRDKAQIEDKFNALLPLVKQVVNIARDQDFTDYEALDWLYNNLRTFNYSELPIQANPMSAIEQMRYENSGYKVLHEKLNRTALLKQLAPEEKRRLKELEKELKQLKADVIRNPRSTAHLAREKHISEIEAELGAIHDEGRKRQLERSASNTSVQLGVRGQSPQSVMPMTPVINRAPPRSEATNTPVELTEDQEPYDDTPSPSSVGSRFSFGALSPTNLYSGATSLLSRIYSPAQQTPASSSPLHPVIIDGVPVHPITKTPLVNTYGKQPKLFDKNSWQFLKKSQKDKIMNINLSEAEDL